MAIKKLLIANRGEIAVRIIRTAKALGIKTVSVFSDADSDSLHRKLADTSIHIGGSAPAESYLKIDTIIAACLESGADAVHPGYGFLSERAEFSEACEKAGILFLGPNAGSMRLLGDKIDAKILAVKTGVPITPGFFEPGATDADLRDAANKIGFPIMLKASAGGGGRGMRIVTDPAQFDNELAVAKDEALKGFGNDAMMVEKLVVDPKHVEVQFAADAHGNVVCLFERECSIQRRHQKLIEEAPSPFSGIPTLWPKMRDSVSSLVKEAGYQGVGTAEFMLDGATGNVYFLEVNARLQVEHCVTEEITDLDLVALQISIAEGKPLALRPELMAGDRSGIGGHSIEVRIVAEDPAKGFLPSIGKIIGWAEPKGPGIRVETGFGKGSEISRYYDSMIAKIVAHGATREAARQRLLVALQDFHILGVQTNIGYLIDVLSHQQFVAGDVDTGFLARTYGDWTSPPPTREVAAIASRATSTQTQAKAGEVRKSVWNLGDDWRVFSAKR